MSSSMTAPPARAMVEPDLEREVLLGRAWAAVPGTIEHGERALDPVQAIRPGPGWCQAGPTPGARTSPSATNQVVRPARRDRIFV